jgi:hypothetical protein
LSQNIGNLTSSSGMVDASYNALKAAGNIFGIGTSAAGATTGLLFSPLGLSIVGVGATALGLWQIRRLWRRRHQQREEEQYKREKLDAQKQLSVVVQQQTELLKQLANAKEQKADEAVINGI